MLFRYMIEIAKSQGVAFSPDPNVMREDEVAAAEAMLIDFQNQGQVTKTICHSFLFLFAFISLFNTEIVENFGSEGGIGQ